MGRKGNDIKWAYKKIILELDDYNLKELIYVCRRLMEVKYVADKETDGVRINIYSVLEKSYPYPSQLIYGVAIFLEFVDVDFLRDLYLASSESFIENSCRKLPTKEMKVIMNRMREEGIIDEILKKFPKQAKLLLEFES